ncbi:hypothetical protein RCH12_002262 [Cryobacterium sp. MP_3.1]|uniref:Uncharacterized protein n=1 Tax=Cryobacterium zongtaii TaxID=1259217 RepID=A0A2S3ZNP1_9MICO|nr:MULTISPECIES: hypothetical protein [Cryobacterium]MEC5184792.1 hypothetical protein [Cryobacterium sp. MP_3.1]POH70746.1 hypothetical protein C3B59_03490 [Cryobacterium zongtaii]
MKTWSFTTYTVAAFACSGFAVALMIVNAATGNTMLTTLLPVAIGALVLGGILSVRARVLRYRGRDITRR